MSRHAVRIAREWPGERSLPGVARGVLGRPLEAGIRHPSTHSGVDERQSNAAVERFRSISRSSPSNAADATVDGAEPPEVPVAGELDGGGRWAPNDDVPAPFLDSRYSAGVLCDSATHAFVLATSPAELPGDRFVFEPDPAAVKLFTPDADRPSM